MGTALPSPVKHSCRFAFYKLSIIINIADNGKTTAIFNNFLQMLYSVDWSAFPIQLKAILLFFYNQHRWIFSPLILRPSPTNTGMPSMYSTPTHKPNVLSSISRVSIKCPLTANPSTVLCILQILASSGIMQAPFKSGR